MSSSTSFLNIRTARKKKKGSKSWKGTSDMDDFVTKAEHNEFAKRIEGENRMQDQRIKRGKILSRLTLCMYL